jgi:hypothetical protein
LSEQPGRSCKLQVSRFKITAEQPLLASCFFPKTLGTGKQPVLV